MNQSLDKALYYLTGNGNFNNVTVDELEKLVSEHPYFPVAQFLLSKKLKDENDGRFLPQVQKTALYFPNPYWLHYQLLNDLQDEPIIHENTTEAETSAEVYDTIIPKENALVVTEEPLPALIDETNAVDTIENESSDQLEINQETTSATEHVITSVFTQDELDAASGLAHETLKEIPEELTDTDTLPAPETEVSSSTSEGENRKLVPNETVAGNLKAEPEATDDHFPETFIDETLQFSEIEELAETSPFKNTAFESEPVHSSSNGLAVNTVATATEEEEHGVYEAEEIIVQPEEEMAAITREADKTTEQFLDELDQPAVAEETSSKAAVETTPIREASTTSKPDSLAEVESSSSSLPNETTPSQPIETAKPEESDVHDKMFQNIKAMLDASAEEANADTKNAFVPIDPYYTIDYFASQGIKLDFEKNADDKLGKQVKKFTQWLKHMKKLGPEDAIKTETISQGEIEAQHTADSSNTTKQVVTEAMALVLEKQGKKEKAIELYRKLSFLNPHKSAYFADKIKNLNGF